MDLPYFDLCHVILDYANPALREGDIETCLHWTNVLLSQIPDSPFHQIRDLEFATCPKVTAGRFDQWTLEQEADTSFGSAYTEMNGFAHNADLWFFSWFAYEGKRDGEDYDYLEAGWVSDEQEPIVLTGMESLQEVFRADWEEEQGFARDICECAIAFKFFRFMQLVTQQMEEFRHPLAVTIHEWDPPLLTINP